MTVFGSCDCCGRSMRLSQSWTSCGLETWACAECRDDEDEEEDEDVRFIKYISDSDVAYDATTKDAISVGVGSFRLETLK